MTTDAFALTDAAYVLGALSQADRREFEDHLKFCAACATSVSELAGLPGLMSRASIDQLTNEPEPVPETLLPSLAREVRRERARRRLVVGAVAGAAACLIGVGTVAVSRSDNPTPAPATSSASSSSTNLALTAVVPSPITASTRLVDMAWGTRIDLTCVYRATSLYPAGGVPYAMIVIDRHGATEQVATWKALPNRTITVMGASSRARKDIAAIEIRTLDGQTILQRSL
jgi:Putative zinc-finger